MAKLFNESEVMNALKERLKGNTKKQIAEELGISSQMLCDILYGRRGMTERIAAGLGFKREVIYRKVA